MPEEKGITKDTSGNTLTVAVSTDLDLYNEGYLKRAVLSEIEKDYLEKVVIDFSECAYIDSSGMGALVYLHKLCLDKKKSLVVTKLNDNILSILRISSLDTFLTIA
jgi:anti-anti-sigma factor